MKIEVTELKAQCTIAYRKHATMEDLVAVMDEGLNAVDSHLKDLGIQPTGAPYAAYLNVDEGSDFAEFDLELGFPIAGEAPVKNGLFLSQTHEGKAVTAIHKGPYHTLEETYGTVMKFIGEHALEPTGTYYDYYLNNPDHTPEKELLTKVVIPVK